MGSDQTDQPTQEAGAAPILTSVVTDDDQRDEFQQTYGLSDEDVADLDNWFSYHPPTPEQIPAFEAIRDAGYDFAEKIMAIIPPSPDRTVAIRRVREAVMNANAALACYPGQERP